MPPFMRMCTFQLPGPLGPLVRLGVIEGDRVIDLNASYRDLVADDPLADAVLPPDMLGFLQSGQRALAAAHDVLRMAQPVAFDLADVDLLAPLPRPRSFRDFMAFEEHMQAAMKRRGEPVPEAWYQIPVYYKGNPDTFIGPEQDALWPRYSQKLDYELELGCVIGREVLNATPDEAMEAIFGFTVINDWSARDIQRLEMQCRLGPAKGKDFCTAMGPVIVTGDELGPQPDLWMQARVNGEVWSEGRSGTIHWSFAQMIAHVSQDERLYPGDVLGSGTVGGGCGLDLDRWVQPGDVVELEIEKIGVLRNRVGRPACTT